MERKLPVPPAAAKAKKKLEILFGSHFFRIVSEAEQLEIENRKLEERLRELKESLKKQKEARETKGGFSWKSGKTGGIVSHTHGVLEENSRRRMEGRRMRVLQVTACCFQPSQAKESDPAAAPASSSYPSPARESAASVQSTALARLIMCSRP